MLIRASCSKCLLSGLEVCQLLCRVLGTITVADRTIGTILCVLSFISYTNLMDLAVSVRYSDQAIGWYTNESGSSIAGKCLVIFFFSKSSRPALMPSQPPVQWVPVTLPGAAIRLLSSMQ